MLKSFAAGITVGAIATLVATQYHVVRTPERVLMISRVHQAPLRSAYVDVREWNPAMWEQFPELAEAVVKAGRRDLLVRDGLSRPAAPAGNPVPQQQVMPTSHPQTVQPTPHPYSVVPTSAPSWTQPTAHGESMLRTARIEPLSLIQSTGNGASSAASETVKPMAAEPVAPVASAAGSSAAVSPFESAPIPVVPVPVSVPVTTPVTVPVPVVPQPEGQGAPAAMIPAAVPAMQEEAAAEGKAETPAGGETRSWFGSILRTVIPKVTESASARASELTVTSASLRQKFQEAERIGISLAEKSVTPAAVESQKSEQIAATPSVQQQEIEPTPAVMPGPLPATVNPVEPQVQTAAEQFPQSPRRLNVVR